MIRGPFLPFTRCYYMAYLKADSVCRIWEINKEKPLTKATPTAEEAKKQDRTFGFW